MRLTINEATSVSYALDTVTGYLTDNSCGDPECCGGPLYSDEEYGEAVKVLEGYGITVQAGPEQ